MSAIEALVRDAPDHRLNRINALAFAANTGLNEERVITGFLHAARLGLFELRGMCSVPAVAECSTQAHRSRP